MQWNALRVSFIIHHGGFFVILDFAGEHEVDGIFWVKI